MRGTVYRAAPALLGAGGDRASPTLAADGSLHDDEAERIDKLPDDTDFAIESIVWLTLFEACRVSIATGHAVIFH